MALKGCLDTRFYFAHYTAEESGWTKKVVEAASLPGSRIISSTITMTELLSVMTREVGGDTVHLRIASAKAAGVHFIPPSEEIATRAGEMVLETRDLPLADALIAATAILHSGGRVYTDDQHYKSISGVSAVWGRG